VFYIKDSTVMNELWLHWVCVIVKIEVFIVIVVDCIVNE
jgi:hypothetical protein